MIFWTRSGEPLEKTKRDLEQNWMNPCTRSSDPPPDETRSEPSDRTGQIPGWSQEGYLGQKPSEPLDEFKRASALRALSRNDAANIQSAS